MLSDPNDDDDAPAVSSSSSSSSKQQSKLMSLFSADEQWKSQGGNSALSYSAKRQKEKEIEKEKEKAKSTAAAASSSPSPSPASNASGGGGGGVPSPIAFASPVTLIRYTPNGQPEVVGPRGCAVFRSPQVILVLYQPDTQVKESITSITPSFSFSVSAPSFMTFTDSAGKAYCLQFATADPLEQLSKVLILAKNFNNGGENSMGISSSASLIFQDLFPSASAAAGNPPTAADKPLLVGDAIKLKYSMYLLTPSSLSYGALVGHVGTDDKPLQMKIGGNKQIQGIEQGVVGMKRCGRRFLVVPPHLAYGAQGAGSVPGNSPVIVEIEVLKVKTAESQSQPSQPQRAESPAAVTANANGSGQSPTSNSTSSDAATASGDAGGERRRESLTKRFQAIGGFRMPGIAPLPSSSSAAEVPEASGASVASPPSTPAIAPTPAPTQPTAAPLTITPAAVPSTSAPNLQSPTGQQQVVSAGPPPSYTPIYDLSGSQLGMATPYAIHPHAHLGVHAVPHAQFQPAHHLSPLPHPSLSPHPSSVAPHVLESKLDHLTSLLSRLLGPNIQSQLLEPPLPVSSIIRCFTHLQDQYVEEKSKRETVEKKHDESLQKHEEQGKKEEKRYDLYMDEMKGKNMQIADLRESIKKLEGEKETLSKQLRDIQSIQQESTSDMQKNLSKKTEEAAALRGELAELRTSIDSLTKERDGAKAELQSQKDSMKEVDVKGSELKMKLEGLTKDYERACREREERAKSADDFERKNSSLSKEIQSLQSSIEALRSSSSSESSSSSSRVSELESSLQSMKAQSDEKDSALERLRKENESLSQKLATESDRAAGATAKSEEKEKEIEDLQRQISELENEKKEIVDFSRQKIETLKAQFKKKLEEMTAQEEEVEEANGGEAEQPQEAENENDAL